MAVELSVSLAASMLGSTSFDVLMRDGEIVIYSGPQPASADSLPTGTRLARIARDGLSGGLRLVLEGNNAIKTPDHVWTLVGEANGTAGWFRWHSSDPEDNICIDGAIGLTSQEGDYQLFMNSLTITPATSINVDNWWFTVPPLGVPV